MATKVTHLPVLSPVTDPAPRRTIRDQDESLTGYLSRIGQQAAPASAKVTTRALAHYASELAILTRGIAVTEIYDAGFADGVASTAAAPHLRLADATSASVTGIREAAAG